MSSTRDSYIRPAVGSDIADLVRLATEFHQESLYRSIPLDKGKLISVFQRAINQKQGDMFLTVYERSDEILGFILGYITSYFFSSQLLAQDLLFYVKKDNRGSYINVRLWKAFREWAASKNAAELSMSISTGITPDRSGLLYQRLGMQYVGGNYKLELRKPTIGV
jgi:hypothetical protein